MVIELSKSKINTRQNNLRAEFQINRMVEDTDEIEELIDNNQGGISDNSDSISSLQSTVDDLVKRVEDLEEEVFE